MVPRDDAEFNEALYNSILGSQSAGKQYNSQGVELQWFAERVLQYFLQYSYKVSVPCFSCHNIYQGMDVAGVPLFDATYSFGFGNNCQQWDLPLFRVLQRQKCGSFYLLWGV